MKTLFRALRWLLLAPFRLVFWLISLPFRFLGWLFSPVVDKVRQNSVYRFLNEVPEDRPTADAIADAFQDPMQIMEQLEDVRKHLLRALLAVIVGVGISFYFTSSLVDFLAAPIGGLQTLQAIQVTETVGVFMRVAVLAGIALATPYIAFEAWLFAAPGLYPRSRKIGLFAIPLATIFFLGGMAFTYYLMLPVTLDFLANGFLDVQDNWTVASYTEIVSGLMFWIGVAFEFPLVIFALSAMGLVQPKILAGHWRLAIVLIAVISAAITPTTDAGIMGLTMLPMIALYLLSILFSYIALATNKGKELIAK
jgi:sec-independent protein translocase protein TatC